MQHEPGGRRFPLRRHGRQPQRRCSGFPGNGARPALGAAVVALLLLAPTHRCFAAADRPTAPAAAAAPEEQPLWELGVAGGALHGPDYPASEQSHLNSLVLPYVIYRGDLLRLGDGGLARIVPLRADWVELDVSVDAAFDADSDRNDAREGMPDLDYLLEIGPQLTFHLLRGRLTGAGKGGVDLNLQARSVFSTDLSSLSHQGYVFSPELEARHHLIAGTDLELRLSVAPLWATEPLMDYFYEVEPRYAQEGRPAFDARGGYLGTYLRIRFSWGVTQRLRLHLGARLGYHDGARNENSPLFTSASTLAFGASFTYAAWQSEETVLRR